MKSSWLIVATALSLGACDKIPGLGGDEKPAEETKVASSESKPAEAGKTETKVEDPKAGETAPTDVKAEGGEAPADAGAAEAGEAAAEAGAAEAGAAEAGAAEAGEVAAAGSGGEAAEGGEVAAEGGEAAEGGDAPAVDPIIRSFKAPVGLWAAWAKKDAVFTVTEAMAAEATLEAKVTRVDIVGGVTVSRIEWTTIRGEERTEEAGPFNAMLLWDDEARIIFGQPEISDEDVAKWVKEPMTYDGEPKEGDPMFEPLPPPLEGSGLVCLVDDQSKEDEECPDVCTGTVCFSAENGLESLEGLMAPDMGAWNRSAVKAEEPVEPEEPTEPEEPSKPSKPSSKKPSSKKPSSKKPPEPTKRPIKRPIKK